jgi:hypothetical protein
MANRIRLNPVGGQNFKMPAMPQLASPGGKPVSMATRVGGQMHNYMGHFAQPKFLAAGHNTSGHMDGGGNWIVGATKNSHGQFRAKAKAAGMSTRAYAEKEAGAPGRLGKQARLAKTLMGMH